MSSCKRRANSPEENSHVASSSSRAEGSESPKKRARRQPQTPTKAPRSSSPSKPPQTPYTPYPLSVLDSPSNPFGQLRKARLLNALPPVSSFSKHICLRFQLVREDIPARLGGVYRVVRVPLSYTFSHLRCLISWLFETPPELANGKKEPEEYLFRVMNKAEVYSMLYKPGQVKVGNTFVKLSNVQDPGGLPADHVFHTDDDQPEEEPEELEHDLEWMDEDDYTLASAYKSGLDPTIAIVYYHSHETQVHITVNTTKLPVTRGISNTPQVFLARGHAHLNPWQEMLPKKPTSETAAEELTDTDAEGDTDEENQEFDKSHPYFSSSPGNVLVEDSDCEDPSIENLTKTLDPIKWNKPSHAFPLYLLKFNDPFGMAFTDIDESFFTEETVHDPFENDDDDFYEDDDDVVDVYVTRSAGTASRGPKGSMEDYSDIDDDADIPQDIGGTSSTPGLSYGSSSLPPSSSPGRGSSPTPYMHGNASSMSLPDLATGIVLEQHYPNKKYSATPAPPKTRTLRLRLRRVEKRMEMIKKADFLCVHDEKPEVKPVKEERKGLFFPKAKKVAMRRKLELEEP